MDDVALVVHLRLLLSGGVAGLGGPGEERGEAAAAGAGEGARALDELLEVGDGLCAPRTGRREQRRRRACAARAPSTQLVRLAGRRAGRAARAACRAPPRPRRCASGCGSAKRSKRPPAAQNRNSSSSLKPKKVEWSAPYTAGPSLGIVDGAQAQEGVVDLATLEVRLAAVHPIRHAGLAEGFFERLEAGGGPVEHRDVAPARRARRLRPRRASSRSWTGQRPASSPHMRRSSRGDRARLVAPRRFGGARRPVVGRAEQHRHPRALGRRGDTARPTGSPAAGPSPARRRTGPRTRC